MRGVNLGGWLVLEPWITPKFFEEVNDGGDKVIYIIERYISILMKRIKTEKFKGTVSDFQRFSLNLNLIKM